MIKVICGKKGSGKTKRIIDMANQSVKDNPGELLFIDDDNRYMFDLRHEIRFINATEYRVDSPDMFLGFLCGTVASNYDMSLLFIDGFLRIVRADINQMEPFFTRLAEVSADHKLQVVLSISVDPAEAPEFLKPYII